MLGRTDTGGGQHVGHLVRFDLELSVAVVDALVGERHRVRNRVRHGLEDIRQIEPHRATPKL